MAPGRVAELLLAQGSEGPWLWGLDGAWGVPKGAMQQRTWPVGHGNRITAHLSSLWSLVTFPHGWGLLPVPLAVSLLPPLPFVLSL